MYIICIQQVDGVHSEDRSPGDVRATRARMRVVCTEERGEGDRGRERRRTLPIPKQQ